MLRRAGARLSLFIWLAVPAPSQTTPPHRMQLGIDADNWKSQIHDARFENSLRRLKVDFISWHTSPEEEQSPDSIRAIAEFCHRNNWSYSFDLELANYVLGFKGFGHEDGTYRYDLAERTLAELKDDPLFLGAVYNEAELAQAMNGMRDPKGSVYQPYFVDTRKMSPSDAFLAVAQKVAGLQRNYQRYGKRLIFEMTFPDYPFAFARGGALLAPKLLKETYNDLMFAVYRGAALEYHSRELWACVDLWFYTGFPDQGRPEKGGHTPAELLEGLQYAYSSGFDFVYIQQYKALMDDKYELTPYGESVLEFQRWRATHKHGDWRTAPIEVYVKRFPDGYWGQDYSDFIPDHPYGSWTGNPYRKQDQDWFCLLNKLSHGTIPVDSDNWNATRSPDYKGRPYQPLAGLPAMVVFDHFGVLPANTRAKVFDLTSSGDHAKNCSAKN